MIKFQPMLTYREKVDLDKLQYPFLLSPKLDGIRCLVHDGQLVSRALKPIPNRFVQEQLRPLLLGGDGLDGELIVGEPTASDCLRVTNSGVMSAGGEPDFTYYLFDDFTWASAPYADRLASLEKMDEALEGSRIKLVPHRVCETRYQVEFWEQHYVDCGYEGAMLHNPRSQYKFGRTTLKEQIAFKLKRWEDDEAVIIEVRELEHNDNEKIQDAFGRAKRSTHKSGMRAGGTMGELVCAGPIRNESGDCVDVADVHFALGTGFSAEQRAWFWTHRDSVVGELVTFKHFAVGVKDRPRNAVFKSLRNKDDL